MTSDDALTRRLSKMRTEPLLDAEMERRLRSDDPDEEPSIDELRAYLNRK